MIVFDINIYDMLYNWLHNHGIYRHWNKGNNSKTAVHEFLRTNNRFNIDKSIENKLQITTTPEGYIKYVKN